jgi:hypothetical protein
MGFLDKVLHDTGNMALGGLASALPGAAGLHQLNRARTTVNPLLALLQNSGQSFAQGGYNNPTPAKGGKYTPNIKESGAAVAVVPSTGVSKIPEGAGFSGVNKTETSAVQAVNPQRPDTSTAKPDTKKSTNPDVDKIVAAVEKDPQNKNIFSTGNRALILQQSTDQIIVQMQAAGMEIPPDFINTFKKNADLAARDWVNGRKAKGESRSVNAYYDFLTRFALATADQMKQTSSTAKADTANADAATTTANTAGMTNDTPITPNTKLSSSGIERPIDPVTGKTYGEGVPKELKKPQPDVPMAVWGDGTWGEGKSDIFGQRGFMNAYNIWVNQMKQTYPNYETLDLSPAGWNYASGVVEWLSDHPAK